MQDNRDACVSRKWKVLFYIIAIIVQVVLVFKGVLFTVRNVVPPLTLPMLCPELSSSQPNFTQGYIFNIALYNVLYFGRCLENLTFQVHFYKFFFRQCTVSDVIEFKRLCMKGLMKKKWILGSFILLSVCLTIDSLSIPSLGIVLELRNGRETQCDPYIYEYYTISWTLDFIRYLHDVFIRLFMVLAMLAVGMIWFEREEQCDASEETDSYPAEPKNYEEYLEEREFAIRDHRSRTQDYTQRGGKVEQILQIFQTWFILPWVLYFIASSLDTEDILKPYHSGSENNSSKRYDFIELTFIVYSSNQLLLLALPYFCTKKINAYHRKYRIKSRREQIKRQKTASRKAFAHINKIEEESQFNFIPRIWGTDIRIQVDNPLYVVLLLVGFFFTVINTLL